MDDFGGRLRQARERRGVSLRQIAVSTKISAAALEALERNDISKLPGGIFSRAFVRSYAVEVGLDPEQTVREFLDRFAQEPAPSEQRIAVAIPEEERRYQEQQRRAARTLTLAGVTLVVIVVAALFIYRNRGRQAQSAPQIAAAAAVPLKLDIHPTSECWVSLTVDGQKLFARIMKPGEHESHSVQREAIVEIGNAAAFAYSVNGRSGKPIGDLKRFTLTPATADQYVR